MKTYILYDVFSLDGFYCTQGYGLNSSYYSRFNLLYHEGTDFGNKNKSVIVRSPLSGKVILDDDDGRGNYGDNVKIWDEKQMCAVQICHLDYNKVSLGDYVKAGDPVGEMGSTGNSTGEHVHFNFFITNASGARLYRTKKSNWGFLDPQHPLDPNPPKFPPGVKRYQVRWDRVTSIQDPMPDEKQYTEKQMTEVRLERDKNWSLYQEQVEKNEELKKKIEDFQTDQKQTEQIFTQRRETLATNLSTVNDWDEILKASARFQEMDNQNLELKDKLDRKENELKKQYLSYEEKLGSLQSEMGVMREQHAEQIRKMDQRVQAEIDALQRVRDEYETVSRFNLWIAKILGFGRK